MRSASSAADAETLTVGSVWVDALLDAPVADALAPVVASVAEAETAAAAGAVWATLTCGRTANAVLTRLSAASEIGERQRKSADGRSEDDVTPEDDAVFFFILRKGGALVAR
ncbi:hypothetical protein [Paraburkholderia sp. Ac-20347]|uniref:hypothetical protein n=1 Tax=Paraburkholderia sp. Ac-20347 TaxID=2703892 RepID=UPI0032180968